MEQTADEKKSWRTAVVILAVLGAAFAGIFGKMSRAPSMVLVLYRLLFAAAILTAPMMFRKREWRQLNPAGALLAAAAGVVLALHFCAYFESLKFTSLSSSIVLVDTEVLFVALQMLVIFREKISARGWIGILLTLAGSVIVAGGDLGSGIDVLRGDLLALLGAVFISVYTVLGSYCRRTMSASQYSLIAYWSGAAAAAVILAVQKIPAFGYGSREYLLGLGLAVVSTLLGHSIFIWGLKYYEASFISVLKLLEPVFLSLLGLMIFFEIPPLTTVFGGAVIITGLYIYSAKKKG